MTNEEAKIFLQSRIELIDKYYPQAEDYREALDMAINAIEKVTRHEKMMDELLEPKYGDYIQHKFTPEYGDVITVEDLRYTFEEVRREDE